MTIPTLRFKADDSSKFGEWKSIQLKDIAERIARKNKEENQNALTISAQMGLVNQQAYFSKQIASRDLSKYYLLHKGEYAYNKSYSAGYPMGAIKRLKLYEKGVVSTLYICFSLNKQVNSDFFEQYVESGNLVPELEKIAQEGARNHGLLNISLQEFFEINLIVPCLKEQMKIATFLSAVDEKISQLSQKLHLLGQYKQGMMQKLFSQQLRFKADDGNEFREWSNKTIGDVANIKRGASPRPINDSKWFDDSSSIGWVRISDVSKSKKYLLQTEQYLSTLGIQKSRLVPKGNLIMSICATIGKPIYTGFDVCIHDGFVVFSELQAIHEYAYYYLEYIEKNWYQYGQAGTQVNLNSDIVSNEAFPFPCLEEQTKIANFLSAIDQKIDVVSEQLEQAKLWKKGLLQQMFV